jgi:hypothetical protein
MGYQSPVYKHHKSFSEVTVAYPPFSTNQKWGFVPNMSKKRSISIYKQGKHEWMFLYILEYRRDLGQKSKIPAKTLPWISQIPQDM